MSDDRRARVMEALRRDLATLAGPKCYLAEPDLVPFYEARVAGYRATLQKMEEGGSDD